MKRNKKLVAILVLSLLLSQWNYAFSDSEPVNENAQVLTMSDQTSESETPTSYIISYYPDKELDPSLEQDLQAQDDTTMAAIAPSMDVIDFPDEDSAAENIEQIKDDPAVRSVEPDQERYLMDAPNDPLYSSQWALKNINAPDAWTAAGTLEKPVVVAVIDSGVMTTHPDLTGRISSGAANFVDSSGNGDGFGHGTFVAGIIAADTGNGVGIAGVTGPLSVSILPIKVFNSLGKGCTTSVLIQAIYYAISRNVDVINMSLGGLTYSDNEAQAVADAIAAGIVVVASAGNDGEEEYAYPASYPGVISVGSIESDNSLSNFSNYNDQLSVVAPGSQILSTTIDSAMPYKYLDGTSFSAPIVSAIAAVIKGEHPSYTPAKVKSIIESTATDLGDSGADEFFGYGKVNFNAALHYESALDSSMGVIDALVFDKDDTMIVTTLGGISGYAYAFSVHGSESNALYDYLSGAAIYALRSGTKYMLTDGTDGYAWYYNLSSTAGRAMIATPSIDSSETKTYYLLKGFDTSGSAILAPIT